MFSAAGRTTANSPPHKRKRTLKIADVSCLVASKQRAAFRSPEKPTKPPSRPQSPLSKNPTLKQEPVANPDMFSQELIEEDNNIQSSMPQYFDHVFGDGGNSQSISQSYVHVGVKDSPSHAPLAIQESQGFTVVSTSLPADNIIIKSESTTAGNECSPVLFSSPTTPPKLPTNYSSCKLAQNSQTLLPSATLTHSTPSATTTIEKPIPPLVPPKAPSSKKEDSTNDKVVKKPSRKRKLSGNRTKYTCPPSCVSLEECVRLKTDSKVSILAIVLQVNPVMEVACKKGSLAGYTVPVASLLLADPTKPCMKLLLWREAACWIERMTAGDIVHFTSIRLKRWQGEVVGHTIMYSKVLNLHQPKKSLPSKFAGMVPLESLQGLQEWGKRRHGYLFRDNQPVPTSKRPVYFKTSDNLGVESLIHFRAKLVTIISERVVLLSDKPGVDTFLYLSFSSSLSGAWYRELKDGVGQVWDMEYLTVSLEGTQSSHSLQVTSRSQLRMLPMDSSDAQAILQKFPSSSQHGSVLAIESISSLLECKSSGIRKCKAKATTFNFQLLDGSALSLHSLSALEGLELVSQLLQAVYIGCEACAKPLPQDMNHVYSPCRDCVVRSPGGHFTSAYCFRPLVIGLSDESATLEVVANQVAVRKLLGGVEASELMRMNLAQNKSQSDAIRDTVKTLLSFGTSKCWILNMVFAVDDFSFVESLTVSLVDWIAA